MTDPQRLRQLLGGFGKSMGWNGAIESGTVVARWREIVGSGIADHVTPTSLRDGVLRVRAQSPAWATEIGYLSVEIVRRVNKALGKDVVTELKVWTGPGVPGTESRPPDGGKSAAAPPRITTEKDAEADPIAAGRRAREAWMRKRS
jgi:predicted nucleic acid-binding Zn ribbon protein